VSLRDKCNTDYCAWYRFVFTEGVLYNQFLSQADYDTVKNYADQLGVVVWCKDDKRTLVVTKDGHDDVKRYYL
jgi:transcription initiation factor TFIIH subunit 4